MPEIIPAGRLILLQDLLIDNTYENTIWFSDPITQAQYFESKCPDTTNLKFTDVNYQRVNSNRLKIRGTASKIMTCNYMMFINEGFPDQYQGWVYAFITDATYINTYCCEITYEIDVIQTFMFNYTLGTCFVEREHTPTDEIGEHIIDEGLPVADYEYTEMYESGQQSALPAFTIDDDLYIVLASTFDDQYNDAVGGDYGAFFSGLVYHIFGTTQAEMQRCKTFVTGASSAGKDGGIVAIFLAPKWAMDYIVNPTSTNVPMKTHTLAAPQAYQNFGSYTSVKNNKLYTYPYNYMQIYNGNGNVAEYKFEKFLQSSSSIPSQSFVLREYFDFSCSPALLCVPSQYEGLGANYVESISCGPFPQLSWVSDTYKCWVAQNGTSTILNAIGSGLSAAAPSVGQIIDRKKFNNQAGKGDKEQSILAPIVTGGMRIADVVLKTISQYAHAKKLPDQAYGNTNASQLLAIQKMLRFQAYRRHARADYAESIDNYFTMFGYTVNKLEIPNIKARKEFTYIKVSECTLHNQHIAQAYTDKIKSVYQNGVRFWVNGDHIGHYEYDNSPLTTP